MARKFLRAVWGDGDVFSNSQLATHVLWSPLVLSLTFEMPTSGKTIASCGILDATCPHDLKHQIEPSWASNCSRLKAGPSEHRSMIPLVSNTPTPQTCASLQLGWLLSDGHLSRPTTSSQGLAASMPLCHANSYHSTWPALAVQRQHCACALRTGRKPQWQALRVVTDVHKLSFQGMLLAVCSRAC